MKLKLKMRVKDVRQALASNIWQEDRHLGLGPAYLTRHCNTLYSMASLTEVKSTYNGTTVFYVWVDCLETQGNHRRLEVLDSLREAVAFINLHAEEALESNLIHFSEDQIRERGI